MALIDFKKNFGGKNARFVVYLTEHPLDSSGFSFRRLPKEDLVVLGLKYSDFDSVVLEGSRESVSNAVHADLAGENIPFFLRPHYGESSSAPELFFPESKWLSAFPGAYVSLKKKGHSFLNGLPVFFRRFLPAAMIVGGVGGVSTKLKSAEKLSRRDFLGVVGKLSGIYGSAALGSLGLGELVDLKKNARKVIGVNSLPENSFLMRLVNFPEQLRSSFLVSSRSAILADGAVNAAVNSKKKCPVVLVCAGAAHANIVYFLQDDSLRERHLQKARRMLSAEKKKLESVKRLPKKMFVKRRR